MRAEQPEPAAGSLEGNGGWRVAGGWRGANGWRQCRPAADDDGTGGARGGTRKREMAMATEI